jgi:hypothetical protein
MKRFLQLSVAGVLSAVSLTSFALPVNPLLNKTLDAAQGQPLPTYSLTQLFPKSLAGRIHVDPTAYTDVELLELGLQDSGNELTGTVDSGAELGPHRLVFIAEIGSSGRFYPQASTLTLNVTPKNFV